MFSYIERTAPELPETRAGLKKLEKDLKKTPRGKCGRIELRGEFCSPREDVKGFTVTPTGIVIRDMMTKNLTSEVLDFTAFYEELKDRFPTVSDGAYGWSEDESGRVLYFTL